MHALLKEKKDIEMIAAEPILDVRFSRNCISTHASRIVTHSFKVSRNVN